MTKGKHSVKVRRSHERAFEDFGWTDNWITFTMNPQEDPEWVSFGPLRVMVENHIQPHSGFPSHPHRDVEIVTYVSSGTLTHGDNRRHRTEITAGEMQLISAGRGMIHSEENLHEGVGHNYQMWLIPERAGTAFAFHQKRYTPDERQGRFRLYVSPDGREDSMPINTDARIYAGLFQADDVINHELEDGRGAWVQVVHGHLTVAGVTLSDGDGAGISSVDALNFEFQADSEVLLFDVRMDVPLTWR